MPRPKEFTVRLKAADRAKLTRVVSSGIHPARMITRARVLLALDESQGDAPDRRVVAERVGTSESTVYLVAKAFATQGGRVEEVIGRKKRATPPVEPKVTGDVEARLIALACSQPPPGRQRWTLRLLEKHVLLTEGIPPLDHSTIGRVLKRARMDGPRTDVAGPRWDLMYPNIPGWVSAQATCSGYGATKDDWFASSAVACGYSRSAHTITSGPGT